MRSRVWLVVVVSVMSVLSACGSDGSTAPPAGTSASTAAVATAEEKAPTQSTEPVVPVPTSTTKVVPEERLLTCGYQPPFPPQAMSGPLIPLDDPDPLMAALREMGPRVGWATGPLRILARTDRYALVAEAHPPDAQIFPGVPPFNAWQLEQRDGAWHYAGHGSCPLFAWVDGMMASPWELDPAASPPTATATELAVLVHEQNCATGRAATGRVREPQVVYGESTIEIAVTVTPATGGQTCPGNPPTPFVIRLREALGERQLLDSGREPIALPGPPQW